MLSALSKIGLSPSTDLDVHVKNFFGILSYVILNKNLAKKEMTGLKKGA
jgi:hypothetical protein